jgi:hypothetical protein
MFSSGSPATASGGVDRVIWKNGLCLVESPFRFAGRRGSSVRVLLAFGFTSE